MYSAVKKRSPLEGPDKGTDEIKCEVLKDRRLESVQSDGLGL